MGVKKRGLGKELGDLLGANLDGFLSTKPEIPDTVLTQKQGRQIYDLPIVSLQRSAYQPRKIFDEQQLHELANSIREQGVLQPILVRQCTADIYEVIAGERRWRASLLAGLDTIPAIIQEIDEQRCMALALVENIQRENLSPIEEAEAIQQLMQLYAYSQQKIADLLGKSRVSVSNLLRILQLVPAVRKLLNNGDIDLGHAKVLLALPEALQLQAAQQIVNETLSVRETEKLVKYLLTPQQKQEIVLSPMQRINTLEKKIKGKLGVRVKVLAHATGHGRITLDYKDETQLETLLQCLVGDD